MNMKSRYRCNNCKRVFFGEEFTSEKAPLLLHHGGGFVDVYTAPCGHKGAEGVWELVEEYKVAAISDNTNSFGLRNVVVINVDGRAWGLGSNSLNLPEVGEVLVVPLLLNGSSPNWATMGFEIPEEMLAAPDDVVEQVWGSSSNE